MYDYNTIISKWIAHTDLNPNKQFLVNVAVIKIIKRLSERKDRYLRKLFFSLVVIIWHIRCNKTLKGHLDRFYTYWKAVLMPARIQTTPLLPATVRINKIIIDLYNDIHGSRIGKQRHSCSCLIEYSTPETVGLCKRSVSFNREWYQRH